MADPIAPPRRGRGRPPLVVGQRSVSVTVALPPAMYARLTRDAAHARSKLAPYIRAVLEYSTLK